MMQGDTMKMKDNALALSINSPENIIKSLKTRAEPIHFSCTVKHTEA